MDWQAAADTATASVTEAATYIIPAALIIVGLVAGGRMMIKFINRGVGK